jgi:hypothetical protein
MFVILSGVAASRSEAATQSKDPYTSDTLKYQGVLPVKRTLLPAAFDFLPDGVPHPNVAGFATLGWNSTEASAMVCCTCT